MSLNGQQRNKLGYAGERPIEVLLQDRGLLVARPRAGRRRDCGDFTGLPMVISAKNVKHQKLGEHISDLESMVLNAGVSTGILWHKRRGKASPLDWYCTTSGRLFLPLLDLAVEHMQGEVG